MGNEPVRILGLDPGLRNTGWGIIEYQGSRLSYVAAGTLRPPVDEALAIRLSFLFNAVSEIVKRLVPNEVAVEETFVNKDARATLKLGQARGVVMAAPAVLQRPVAEYAANLVKKTIVGTGHAEKRQIRAMIGILLPKAEVDSDDAADALAIAICHAYHRTTLKLVV